MYNLDLQEADRAEVMVLVDNYTDVLSVQSTDVVKRPIITPSTPAPVAQHGLSCLVKVYKGPEEHHILMDVGRSPLAVPYNIDVFDVDVTKIECVVLSHGHPDHFGGLFEFLGEANEGMSVILHPDAFLERRLNMPGIGFREMPQLKEEALKRKGANIIKAKEPSSVCSNLVLALGETERVTDFEKGFPLAEAKIQGKWITDPFYDDQGVAINVKGKGLVVIGGCSHAGIINTIKYAQQLTGVNKVFAVLGGFHLVGPIFEPIVETTINEMKSIGPDFIVPMHCTGWKAITRFSQEMAGEFILNTVGTTYVF
jgi:7,8-dihydropterin-6-yl-methyl-4-(beta-D-ribofuranosyl)aminobenzene 5'-phosphate synthase